MTFPAIMNATQSPIAGAAAMVIGIVAAWCGLGLLPVSLICCVTVLILEHFYRVSKSCKSTLRGFRWVFIKQSTERIDTDTLHFSCQHTM